MKGIYKKISAGVLAAALVVGGSGILHGSQAFAASNNEEVFAGDFDGLWDYYYIKGLENEYDYKFIIESISKQVPSKIDGELKDGIDFIFLLKRGKREDKNRKLLDLNKVKGQEQNLKIGKYYYKFKF